MNSEFDTTCNDAVLTALELHLASCVYIGSSCTNLILLRMRRLSYTPLYEQGQSNLQTYRERFTICEGPGFPNSITRHLLLYNNGNTHRSVKHAQNFWCPKSIGKALFDGQKEETKQEVVFIDCIHWWVFVSLVFKLKSFEVMFLFSSVRDMLEYMLCKCSVSKTGELTFADLPTWLYDACISNWSPLHMNQSRKFMFFSEHCVITWQCTIAMLYRRLTVYESSMVNHTSGWATTQFKFVRTCDSSLNMNSLYSFLGTFPTVQWIKQLSAFVCVHHHHQWLGLLFVFIFGVICRCPYNSV